MFDYTCDEFTTFELSILEPCLKKGDRYLEAAVNLNNKYFEQILTPSLVADIVLCSSLTLPSSMPPGFANYYSDHVINLCHDARSDVINMMSMSFAEENVGFGVNRVNRFISKFCKEEFKKIKTVPSSIPSEISGEYSQKTPSKPRNIDISLETFKRLLSFNPIYLTFPSYRHVYISAISSLVLLNIFVETFVKILIFILPFCIMSESSSIFYEVYCRVFNLVLDRLEDEIKRCDQYFVDIILEAPHLPFDFLPKITSFCSNTETLTFGLNVVMKMIKANDASFQWLGLLLDLSICDLKKSREAVIKIILEIYKSDDESYTLKIDKFLLNSLEVLPSMVSLDPGNFVSFKPRNGTSVF
ncbi:hypothetical protein MXB_4922 [Myxobolus squamalis]|nr:hypothetical protein MXB_4922 [Myxobolus squamalis]